MSEVEVGVEVRTVSKSGSTSGSTFKSTRGSTSESALPASDATEDPRRLTLTNPSTREALLETLEYYGLSDVIDPQNLPEPLDLPCSSKFHEPPDPVPSETLDEMSDGVQVTTTWLKDVFSPVSPRRPKVGAEGESQSVGGRGVEGRLEGKEGVSDSTCTVVLPVRSRGTGAKTPTKI